MSVYMQISTVIGMLCLIVGGMGMLISMCPITEFYKKHYHKIEKIKDNLYNTAGVLLAVFIVLLIGEAVYILLRYIGKLFQ